MMKTENTCPIVHEAQHLYISRKTNVRYLFAKKKDMVRMRSATLGFVKCF